MDHVFAFLLGGGGWGPSFETDSMWEGRLRLQELFERMLALLKEAPEPPGKEDEERLLRQRRALGISLLGR